MIFIIVIFLILSTSLLLGIIFARLIIIKNNIFYINYYYSKIQYHSFQNYYNVSILLPLSFLRQVWCLKMLKQKGCILRNPAGELELCSSHKRCKNHAWGRRYPELFNCALILEILFYINQ